MITKNNKKLIISGILFIIATVCYPLDEILLHSYYSGGLAIRISYATICKIISFIILALYCFVLHKTKAEKMVYLFGFIAFALFFPFYTVNRTGNIFYMMNIILFLTITVFMIMAKIKMNRPIFITGTTVFVAYAVVKIVGFIGWLLDGSDMIVIVDLIYELYLIAEFVAIFNLWLFESRNSLFNEMQKTSGKTLLQDDLMLLKQLLDSGRISNEEYNRKKSEILNKL